MSVENDVQQVSDKTFKIGTRSYRTLGKVEIGKSGPKGDDFVRLTDVHKLIPEDVETNKVYILGNRDGAKVYERIS